MPEGVDPQAWADYMTVRKAKRAGPMTETAMKAFAREAGKAGVDLSTAVTACAEYEWRGFSAQWYAERTALAAPAYKPAPAQPSRYQPAPPRYAAAGAAIFGNQNQNPDDWRTVDAQ